MRLKFIESFHFSIKINKIDDKIKELEDENPTRKVVKVEYMGKIHIGNNEYIINYMLYHRFSFRKTFKNLPKILGCFLRNLY